MNGSGVLKTTLNLLLSALFIGLALYVFLTAPSAGWVEGDLRLYAAVTGTYGLWRLIRTATGIRNSDGET